MLKKFKQWVCRFVFTEITRDPMLYTLIKEEILRDDLFIKNLTAIQRKLKDKADVEASQKSAAGRYLLEQKNRQEACTHLKGSKLLRYPHLDYAIWNHHFSDGTRSVKCMLCGKTWKGEQLKSKEVMHMLENTTNTMTSSEQTIYGEPKKTEDVYPPTESGTKATSHITVKDYIVKQMKWLNARNKTDRSK